jgi:hypothetical protein
MTIVTNQEGTTFHYNEKGELHREDGPAIERVNGTKEWYLNDQRHRVNGPAFERSDGTKVWFLNGQCHRVDGPAIEDTDGYKAWYLNGQYHREDGPAVEYPNGYKEWWVNGQCHRTDGPAVESAYGTKEWWVDDKHFTEEEFNQQKEDGMKKETTGDLINKSVNTNSILCSFVDLMKNSDDKFVYFCYGDDNAGSVMVYEDVEKETGEIKTKYEIYMKYVGNGHISVGFETENNISDIQCENAASLLIRMSDMGEHYDSVFMDIRAYMSDVVKWPKEIISIMLREVKIRKS